MPMPGPCARRTRRGNSAYYGPPSAAPDRPTIHYTVQGFRRCAATAAATPHAAPTRATEPDGDICRYIEDSALSRANNTARVKCRGRVLSRHNQTSRDKADTPSGAPSPRTPCKTRALPRTTPRRQIHLRSANTRLPPSRGLRMNYDHPLSSHY
ncbi:hypothetical protein EVAR_19024_1 [Eumeta japonica]|uniref:Uncharacterized protein n=1 Tax=Eumeta variegata TaxID=151549 RepID=A0A4C1V747_EUMVA|nr:hypothetical protein EVAR_19024_1 [Eumeta japonica]